jgi:hypothetical protein
MVARRRDSDKSAQEELGGIAADLERAYPDNGARGAHVEAFIVVSSLVIVVALAASYVPSPCRHQQHRQFRGGTIRHGSSLSSK